MANLRVAMAQNIAWECASALSLESKVWASSTAAYFCLVRLCIVYVHSVVQVEGVEKGGIDSQGALSEGPAEAMASSEGIVCALVARGPTILAEHSTVSGNSSLVALSILEKQAAGLQGDQRVSYLADRHAFHLLVKQGLTYLCVADQSMGKRLPYLLLDDLCVRVEKDGALSAEAASAPAYSLTKRLGPVLSERVAFFNDDPSADALSRVQGQVQELKSVMVDNIDRILDRGERLELLVHRTDDLQVGSIAFRRDAHRAKRAFQWQHLRLKLAVGGGVLLLAYIVVCVVCSPTFQC